jgi:hypothetical protein
MLLDNIRITSGLSRITPVYLITFVSNLVLLFALILAVGLIAINPVLGFFYIPFGSPPG